MVDDADFARVEEPGWQKTGVLEGEEATVAVDLS